jgi:hypothetical protein
LRARRVEIERRAVVPYATVEATLSLQKRGPPDADEDTGAMQCCRPETGGKFTQGWSDFELKDEKLT